MSFNDVCNLVEHLNVLGYPERFPMSALCSQHGSPASFRIVSGILKWLIARLEPGVMLMGGTETENERVALIRSAAEILVTRAGIKVNPRKLYSSSVAAAKELLKITNLLVNTSQVVNKADDEFKNMNEIDLSDKIDSLRRIRELSSELTNKGAVLYELLGKEMTNRDIRNHQASRPMELSTVERTMKTAINSLQSEIQSKKMQLEQSRVDLNNLDNRLQRKQQELERNRQRLSALQKVRPSYLEEFEKLEEELRSLFEVYIVKHRTVDALRSALAKKDTPLTPIASPVPQVGGEGSMTVLPEGFLIDSDEETGPNLNDGQIEEEDDDEVDNDLMQLKEEIQKVGLKSERVKSSTLLRPRVRTGGRTSGANPKLIDLKKSNRLSSSEESDSELQGFTGDLQQFIMEDNMGSEDDDDVSEMVKGKDGSKTMRQDHSDEDF